MKRTTKQSKEKKIQEIKNIIFEIRKDPQAMKEVKKLLIHS